MKRIFSVFVLMVLFQSVYSQQFIKITGQIIDDDTEEAQPFATVAVKGTSVGTTADLDGYYTLTVDTKTLKMSDSILVSAIGYKTFRWRIYAEPAEQVLNIRLKSATFSIGEVVILSGENPANIIVRNIIKNKDRNSVKGLESYKAEIYDKMELDLDNISEKFQERKVMRPFKFVFDNVDSLSDVKPFLPAYMTEEVGDLYYTKAAGKEKIMLRARKVSGIENESVINFIGSMQQSYDIYDNWYEFLGRQFISPFANNGLGYYEYYIQDSTFVKGHWSYKLKFKPRRPQELTFYGDFWVDMKTYAVEIVNMRMNPEANVNFVERIILYHECDLERDSMWLPSKNKVIIDFVSTKSSPGIIGRKTTTFRDYVIKAPELEAIYKKSDPDRVDAATLVQADTFWDAARHENLSANERSVYVMIDSIKKVPIYKTYVDVIKTVVTGYKSLGPIEVGPYFSLVSQNPVEGWRMKLAVGTTNKLSKRIWVYGYGAYGTKDEDFKYMGKVQFNITRKPFSFIGAAYKNDIDLKNENSEEPSEDNLLAGIYRRRIPQKLLKVHEAKVFYQKAWWGGFTNRITLIHRDMDPYDNIADSPFNNFNVRYLAQGDSGADTLTKFNTTEAIFKLHYGYKEKFLSGAFLQSSLGSRYPIVELQYTIGMKGIMGSQFNYHRLNFFMSHWFNVGTVGWMKYYFQAGKTWGNLPYLLLEVHDGNETYFYLKNAFNGMNRFEFVSDQYVQLIFEHHLDGFLLNHIPLVRKLKWREVLGGKILYGSLTDRNKADNALSNYDRTYTDYRNNPRYNEGSFYGTFDPGKPYIELSAGIENIFKILRVDALWRLNYLNSRYASPLTVRATMQFVF